MGETDAVHSEKHPTITKHRHSPHKDVNILKFIACVGN